jgi:hypothetical protein
VWAGANVCTEDDESISILTSQEKWDRLKDICTHWLDLLEQGETFLVHKKLQYDHGFMVYVNQAYSRMKPYLKGFHLLLETWRGGRDEEGCKIKTEKEGKTSAQVAKDLLEGDEGGLEVFADREEVKTRFLTQVWSDNEDRMTEPPVGLTKAVPRFKDDLAVLLSLAVGEQPAIRHTRSHHTLAAYYGFSNAASGGFGSMVQQPNGLFGRYGLWGRDVDNQNN